MATAPTASAAHKTGAPWWSGPALALATLTRVPLPARATRAENPAWDIALCCFPAVGLLLGGLCVATASLSSVVLPPRLAALLVIAASAAATGALHLDGLCDTFDGLGALRGGRQRALQAMRDSYAGSFGVVALCLCLLLKWSALELVLEAGKTGALWIAPTVARGVATVAVVAFPYAHERGLGRAFHDHGRKLHAGLAVLFGTLCVAGIAPTLWTAAALGAATALGFAGFVRARLGGLTGDVYGAVIEIAEVAVLVVAAAG